MSAKVGTQIFIDPGISRFVPVSGIHYNPATPDGFLIPLFTYSVFLRIATNQPIFDAVRQYKQEHPSLSEHAYDMELILYHPLPEQLTPPSSCIPPSTLERFFLILRHSLLPLL